MSTINLINRGAIVDAFFSVDPQRPLPELVSPFFVESCGVEEKFEGLKNLQLGLTALLETIFKDLHNALSLDFSGFFLNWGHVVIMAPPPWHGATAEKISTLFNKVIGHNFGLTLHKEVSTVNNSVISCVSWSKENDLKLRSLLDTPLCYDLHNHLHVLNSQRKYGKETDISFVVEGHILHAHKAIITKNFSRSLSIKTEQSPHDAPIEIKGAKAKAFDSFLDYLYTGQLFLYGKPITDIIDIALLADKFAIEDLKNLCRLRLLCSLSCDNFWAIAGYAAKVDDKILLQACHSPQRYEPVVNPEMFTELFFGSHNKIFFTKKIKVILDEVQKALVNNLTGTLIPFKGFDEFPLFQYDQGLISQTNLIRLLFERILPLHIKDKGYSLRSNQKTFFVT